MVGPRTDDGEQPQYNKFSFDLDDERCFMCVLCVVEWCYSQFFFGVVVTGGLP
ncbi:hypothetical protein QYF36_008348 [Acer negundo]|nr:hypothetical protein QYF36_008348 [Acer negundo]